jgi:hypothetical protein
MTFLYSPAELVDPTSDAEEDSAGTDETNKRLFT